MKLREIFAKSATVNWRVNRVRAYLVMEFLYIADAMVFLLCGFGRRRLDLERHEPMKKRQILYTNRLGGEEPGGDGRHDRTTKGKSGDEDEDTKWGLYTFGRGESDRRNGIVSVHSWKPVHDHGSPFVWSESQYLSILGPYSGWPRACRT